MYVAVSKLQIEINARSSREMSQTVRIDDIPSSREFVSQFGLAIFVTRKTPKDYPENRVSRKCLLNEPARNPSKESGRQCRSRSIDRQLPAGTAST